MGEWDLGEERFRPRQSICQAHRKGGIKEQLRKRIGRNLGPFCPRPNVGSLSVIIRWSSICSLLNLQWWTILGS